MGPDHDLVLALGRADRAAFLELYRRYHSRIWRFLVRLTGSPRAAEDLFQETWVAAARHACRLREDTVLLPWLYTIARNKYRNLLRFQWLERGRGEGFRRLPSAASVLPDEATDARLRAERAARVFASLPDAHREVLLLCLGEGLTAAEAGSVLGIREAAVRKRLSRARQQLAQGLGIDEQEAP